LKDIEIIFINDASKDNSTKIIEDLMKKDKRIIHIKNNTIRRKFNSKKKGVLKAKGEYILIMNPEDLLLNNILEKAYETIKKNNLDILQYYIMIGSYRTNRLWKNIKYKSGIIYHPKIKDYFFNSYLPQINDKLIKREIFSNSMKYMDNYFNNDAFDFSDNDLAIFALSKTAKSYGFLEDVGYFYNIRSSLLTVDLWFRNKNVDKIFGKFFNVSKYFLENTGDNRQEKLFAYKFLYNKIYKYRFKLYYLFNNFDAIDKILNEFLKCRFYNKNEKEKIQLIKNLVSIAQKLNYNYNYNFTFRNISSL
jgi:glycosyltransferase involved in cell wall biosynthesis